MSCARNGYTCTVRVDGWGIWPPFANATRFSPLILGLGNAGQETTICVAASIVRLAAFAIISDRLSCTVRLCLAA